MQALYFDIAAVVLLGIVVFQDFKQRAISWILLPLLAGIYIVKALWLHPEEAFFLPVLVNLLIVTSILALTGGYYFFRYRTFRFIDKALGTGDVLLLGVFAVALSPVSFVLFLSGSFLVTLAGYLLYTLIFKKSTLIPLAGCLAFFMILHMALPYFFPPGLPDAGTLISLIT